jgi:hypothetical protein
MAAYRPEWLTRQWRSMPSMSDGHGLALVLLLAESCGRLVFSPHR